MEVLQEELEEVSRKIETLEEENGRRRGRSTAEDGRNGGPIVTKQH